MSSACPECGRGSEQNNQVRYLYRQGISGDLLIMSSMQQRKAEILAKRAKLAELKRQRELRQQEFSLSRANSGEGSEVWVTP